MFFNKMFTEFDRKLFDSKKEKGIIENISVTIDFIYVYHTPYTYTHWHKREKSHHPNDIVSMKTTSNEEDK